MLRCHPRAVPVLVVALSAMVTATDATLRLNPVYEPQLGMLLPGGVENVFRGAKTEASGHWNDRVPTFAVDGKADSASDHWGVEGLPTRLMLGLVRLTFRGCSAGDIALAVEIAGGVLDEAVAWHLQAVKVDAGKGGSNGEAIRGGKDEGRIWESS